MEMAWIWTGMVSLSLVFGVASGSLDAVANAALEGARSAIDLSLSMAGVLCLWSGVMEIMNATGVSAGLAKWFRPVLRRLLPEAAKDKETLAAVSANVSANLLGLGNAATPLGIQAARRMAAGCGGTASNELCLLVVLNTASIQLIPATIASVRAAAGCQTPFDILPAVWLSSALSVTAGLATAWLLSRRRRGMNWGSLVIPLLLSATAVYGLGKKVDVYAALTHGAEEGLTVLLRIVPALVGLLTAVSMFRASGAMEWLSGLFAPALELAGIPPETTPLLLVRPVSGNGALAVASDLMHTYGPDSSIGRTAAVMLGSTETTFYTIAVYFGSAGIHKTRHTVPAALAADLTGFIAAALAVRLFFGS